MKIKIAFIEEPPFYWTDPDHSVTGADIELADVVLRAIGVSAIEYHSTSFKELLPGVQDGRWDMNVPIFVTPERAERVAFSAPVWAIGDGFLVRHDGKPNTFTSYEAVAAQKSARLGMVAGTVQFNSAQSAGVNDGQIVFFKSQTDAVAALVAGKIDAYASTAVGSRVLAHANKELESVALEQGKDCNAPVGAFSFNKNNYGLVQAMNGQLRKYLGSVDHRARMAKYGITKTEIDGVISGSI